MSDRDLWDAEAPTFDDAADHGLADPAVRAAWRSLLLGHLPAAPARVADLGCGTGTLTQLLAEEGYDTVGVDFSPEMLVRARAKAPGLSFVEGDAADPPLGPEAYDVVLCRHVLWALPEPVEVLRRWARLLAGGGRLLLVEGHWSTGAGLTAAQTSTLLTEAGLSAEVVPLPSPALWGREIADERYLVVAQPRG